nr:integrase, catalytic region, zinc finger, CCHC-type, peptidase aspartic, catalytic [Tanacetum cinerariifolium]
MTLRDFLHFPRNYLVTIVVVVVSALIAEGSPDVSAVSVPEEEVDVSGKGIIGSLLSGSKRRRFKDFSGRVFSLVFVGRRVGLNGPLASSKEGADLDPFLSGDAEARESHGILSGLGHLEVQRRLDALSLIEITNFLESDRSTFRGNSYEVIVFRVTFHLASKPRGTKSTLDCDLTRHIPNGKALRKCILSGPYKPTIVLVQAVDATDDSPAIPKHTTVETPMNMTPENKANFEAEKEAIHLILTGIGDEIYSTPEWSRFVTIVKQQHKLDEVSCHKLFDILKQYQKEVNELRAERLARDANPLALVATAQANQDPYYQTSKFHKSHAPSSKPYISTRSHTTTRYKGKEIANPITPPSEIASKEDSGPEQAQRDKDMNKNVDTTPRYKNDNQSGQFGNQRTVNVVGPRENVRSPVVQQSGIQCFNYKEFGHFAKECKKPKRELEAHYSYMAKIQEVPTADSGTDSKPVEQVQNDGGYNVFANDLQHSEQSEYISNTCLVEMDDSNVIPDSPDMCNDDIQNDQNDVESDYERVALANLIANLKLDVDENKKIQKQLKKANATLAQELKECKIILVETSKSLGESISVQDSCLVAFQTKQAEFEKYKAFNDHTIDYDKLERKPAPFSNSFDRIYFPKTKSVLKANVSEGLSKPVTAQTLPQTAGKVILQLILLIVDSGCTKHITGNLKLLCNFVEKFLGTVHFGNDQFAPILGYGDLVPGNITINRVY